MAAIRPKRHEKSPVAKPARGVFVGSVASPLIIAHRGASAEKPENTLAAFRRAVALGVDGLELDIHVTPDGVPVVFHDAGLFRLTGVHGDIATTNWRELKKLRVLGCEPIPRLVDVLESVRGRAVVQIELKAGGPVAPVFNVIESARAAEWVILASFSAALLREAFRLAPAVPRMLITSGRRSRPSLTRELAAVGANGLSVDHRAVNDAKWVRYFHSRGYLVWCWTVNNSRRASQLSGWGIDALLTDNPALLKRTV